MKEILLLIQRKNIYSIIHVFCSCSNKKNNKISKKKNEAGVVKKKVKILNVIFSLKMRICFCPENDDYNINS
jgi:hypothetical protein